MMRAVLASWLCCGLSLGALGGCSFASEQSSREHLPVVGLTAASVYAEYGSEWAEQRWQTPIAQTIWKLVLPVGRVEDRTLAFEGQAWRSASSYRGRDYSGDHGGGSMVGATAAAMPRSGYALADRTNTFAFANSASGSSTSVVVSNTQVAWDAKSLNSTHRYQNETHEHSLSGATQERAERPLLAIEAEAAPEYLAPGDRTEWIVRVTNRGSAQARDARLHLELPARAKAHEVEGVRGVEELETGLVLKLGDVSVDTTLRVAVSFELESTTAVLAAAE
ncbi:MAG: hypothetical protein RLN76_10130 [Phycisphaeraceae bacterium]